MRAVAASAEATGQLLIRILLGVSLAFAASVCGSAVLASPSDYVYVPGVEYGEKEIDFKSGSARDSAGNRESAASLGFGWGATPFWFTEIYGKWEKVSGERNRFEAYEWENKFQLTETGRYVVDIGLITEIELPRESKDPKEFKFGPLLQTEFEKTQVNLNLLFERKFGGSNASGEERTTEMGYQWQIKYRARREFEFGAQGFGTLGEWNHWEPRSEQTHIIGPAVFGKVDLGSRHGLRYNAAWLLGVNAASANNTFRMQMEYEF